MREMTDEELRRKVEEFAWLFVVQVADNYGCASMNRQATRGLDQLALDYGDERVKALFDAFMEKTLAGLEPARPPRPERMAVVQEDDLGWMLYEVDDSGFYSKPRGPFLTEAKAREARVKWMSGSATAERAGVVQDEAGRWMVYLDNALGFYVGLRGPFPTEAKAREALAQWVSSGSAAHADKRAAEVTD
jgi:hypothetical protein